MKKRITTVITVLAISVLLAVPVSADEYAVTGLKASSGNFRQVTLEWDPVRIVKEDSETESYEDVKYSVYRAASSEEEFSLVSETTSCSYIDKLLAAGTDYRYMIVAESESGITCSSEEVTMTPLTVKKVKLTLKKKGKSFFDLCYAAGEKLYGYDTLQGACANNGTGYFVLYNRKVVKCKIVKVRLKDMKIKAVSKPLKIYHGNSIAYNTQRNVVSVACASVKPEYIAEVDPKTLKLIRTVKVELTEDVKKVPDALLESYSGINAISYNEKYGCYFARLKANQNYIKLDNDLRPVKYIKSAAKKNYLTYQALDSYGSYIYDVQSFKGSYKYNMITVRTVKGAYAGEAKISYGSAFELECVFHDGEQFYVGYYYSKYTKKGKKLVLERHTRIYAMEGLL